MLRLQRSVRLNWDFEVFTSLSLKLFFFSQSLHLQIFIALGSKTTCIQFMNSLRSLTLTFLFARWPICPNNVSKSSINIMKHAESKLTYLRLFRYESCRKLVYGPTYQEKYISDSPATFSNGIRENKKCKVNKLHPSRGWLCSTYWSKDMYKL